MKDMKKVIMALCFAMTSTMVSAQEFFGSDAAPGDWGVGMNIVMGTGRLTNFGLNPKLQYYCTSALRVETSFSYFVEKHDIIDWDLNLNFHYVIPMKYGFSVYPVIGATFLHRNISFTNYHSNGTPFEDSDNYGRFGLNAGVGFQYDISPEVYVDYEIKYQYVGDFDRCNMHIGICYRF